MPPRKKTIEDKVEAPVVSSVVNQLMARYPGRVFRGKDYTMPWMLRRLPTGILGLDIDMSGGFPAGGLSVIIGPENVGKNYLLNATIANQQRLFGDACKIAIISSEMPYDKMHARNAGVRVSLSDDEIDAMVRAAHVEGFEIADEEILSWKDEVGTFLTVPPAPAEELFDIAVDIIRSREFNIVGIDSFGALMSKDDEEKDFGDGEGRGGRGQAKLNTSFMNKLTAAMGCDAQGHPNLTCVLALNQVRDNQNRANAYSPTTVEGGGRALKHGRFVTVELKPTDKIRAKVDGKDVVVGRTVGWTIAKQKAGGHDGHKGDYEYLYELNGINKGKEVLKEATSWGVVVKKGASYSFEGMNLAVGIDNAATVLNDTPELLEEIEKKTLQAAGIRCLYK